MCVLELLPLADGKTSAVKRSASLTKPWGSALSHVLTCYVYVCVLACTYVCGCYIHMCGRTFSKPCDALIREHHHSCTWMYVSVHAHTYMRAFSPRLKALYEAVLQRWHVHTNTCACFFRCVCYMNGALATDRCTHSCVQQLWSSYFLAYLCIYSCIYVCVYVYVYMYIYTYLNAYRWLSAREFEAVEYSDCVYHTYIHDTYIHTYIHIHAYHT
jgi:hypothetical protein